MKSEQTVYVDVEDIRGARLGFFRHEGLGKLVRVTPVEQPEGIVIEVCTRESLRRINGKSGANYIDWARDPAIAEKIGELVTSEANYDPNLAYQSFAFKSTPEYTGPKSPRE